MYCMDACTYARACLHACIDDLIACKEAALELRREILKEEGATARAKACLVEGGCEG